MAPWRNRPSVRHQSASGSILFYEFAPGSAFNTADTGWVRSMVDGSNHMHLRLPQPKEIYVPARTIAEIDPSLGPSNISRSMPRVTRKKSYQR